MTVPAGQRVRPRTWPLVLVTVSLLLGATLFVVQSFTPGEPVLPPADMQTEGATPSSSAQPLATVPAAPAGKVPVPAKGAYLGAYAFPQGGRRAAIAEFEKKTGRKLAIDHVYYGWADEFPTDDDKWTVQQGRIPFLNWSSALAKREGQLQFADIAAGKHDDVIDARADDVKAFGSPIFLSFQHEPGRIIGSGPDRAGTSEDYVAAWRHIVERFEARGATNVSWVWILTAASYKNSTVGVEAAYPGDDVIDWIGVDGYNGYLCIQGRNWRTFKTVFKDFYAWAEQRDKPLMVAEWGVTEDPQQPGRKGEWYKETAEALSDLPRFKALVYFNSAPACENWIDTSESALAGFQELAKHPNLSAVPQNGAR